MVCRKIVVIICTVGFIIHSIACVFKEIATRKKAVDVTPVKLSSIEFPLLFGITINSGSLKLEELKSNKHFQGSCELMGDLYNFNM